MSAPTCDPKTHPSPCACCEWRLTVELPALRAEIVTLASDLKEATTFACMESNKVGRLENERDALASKVKVLSDAFNASCRGENDLRKLLRDALSREKALTAKLAQMREVVVPALEKAISDYDNCKWKDGTRVMLEAALSRLTDAPEGKPWTCGDCGKPLSEVGLVHPGCPPSPGKGDRP